MDTNTIKDFIAVTLRALQVTKGQGPYTLEDITWRLEREAEYRKEAYDKAAHTSAALGLEMASYRNYKGWYDAFTSAREGQGWLDVVDYVRQASEALDMAFQNEHLRQGEANTYSEIDFILTVENYANALLICERLSDRELLALAEKSLSL